MIAAFPLEWPTGWPRTEGWKRSRAKFSRYKNELSVADGLTRVLRELDRMGIRRDDVVVSTNVRTRLDGWPRSDQPNPDDPGVSVYWQEGKHRRVMAIDIYDRVADNLGAVAATIEAMRAIERHGGAQILERAFTGFEALPNPHASKTWRDVLGFTPSERPSFADVEARYRTLAQARHPDRGGSDNAMAEINRARDQARQALTA
jgi:hypothetical protein